MSRTAKTQEKAATAATKPERRGDFYKTEVRLSLACVFLLAVHGLIDKHLSAAAASEKEKEKKAGGYEVEAP